MRRTQPVPLSAWAEMSDRHEFCTIVDQAFVPQVLVLLRSLQNTDTHFRLQAFCLDDVSLKLLGRLGGRGAAARDFAEVEAADPDLRTVRQERTRSEYCWTATPAICRHILRREPDMRILTYLDADLMFFADPQPLLSELDGASMLLFPQRISNRLDGWSQPSAEAEPARRLTETYGSFNAGSISFRNDASGNAAIEWWRERCIEWCFDRKEPGRWADQRYLEEMPARFAGVRVSEHPGAALAPWNTDVSGLTLQDGVLRADATPVIFHHFQSLRLVRAGRLRLELAVAPNWFCLRSPVAGLAARHDRDYALSATERRLLWAPYVRQLERALTEVLDEMPEYVSRIPSIRCHDMMRDALHAGYLRLYRLAGRVLPPALRTALSRARSSMEHRRVLGTRP